MTPASLYRQASSSVARSPHDIPRPAISLQVNPVRLVPGTTVRVFGNVMRVSPLHAGRPEAPADEGAQRAERGHSHAWEIYIRGQDPGQRGQIHGHGLLTVGGQEVA